MIVLIEIRLLMSLVIMKKEGRRKREEGRRKKKEGKTKNEENIIIFLSSNSQSLLKSFSFISSLLRVLSVFAVR